MADPPPWRCLAENTWTIPSRLWAAEPLPGRRHRSGRDGLVAVGGLPRDVRRHPIDPRLSALSFGVGKDPVANDAERRNIGPIAQPG